MMVIDPQPGAARWREARTMADLGTLTAEWLTGDLPFHPGCDAIEPIIGIDEPVAVLVLLNHRRMVSTWSQPGCDYQIEPNLDVDVDYRRLRQRAAVSMLAWDERIADRLVAGSRAAGLRVIDNGPARRWRDDSSMAMVATTIDGWPTIFVGPHLSRWTLRRRIFPGVGRWAVRAACDARQITVVDPRWGRTGLLWSTLLRAVEGGR